MHITVFYWKLIIAATMLYRGSSLISKFHRFSKQANICDMKKLNQPILQTFYSSSNIITKTSNTRGSSNVNLYLMCATFTALAALSSSSSSEGSEQGDKFGNTALYPAIEPFQVATIKVSNIHTISYSQYGNPNGKPVLFVHGGPGGGTDPNMARFFDPKVYRIILVDQRGCGKSTPFAELRENTTYDLVEDFEKIRVKLGIQKWQIFGGSWGSTLALAYATSHPLRVTELVLRGIFLIRKKEIDWFYEGGASAIFPEEWEAYENAIPIGERDNFVAAYGRRLRGELGEDEMKKAAKAWSIWEGRTSKLVQDPWEDVKNKFGADDFSLAFARIENHYFTNKGFFPRDGYLLEQAQIDKIKHIPTFIVQGRYDVVCPAMTAFDLKKKLPDAKIVYTITGHSGFETEIIKELVSATDAVKHL